MLLDVLPRLRGVRLVLASSSPRRVEMLRGAGLAHLEVVPSNFAETLDKAGFASAAAYALATARGKADEVLARLEALAEAPAATDAQPPPPQRPLVLIACDTVIEAPTGEVLEKPRDRADAARMLRLPNYGLAPGCAADLMVIDAPSAAQAILQQSPRLAVFKAGVQVAGPLSLH